MREDFNALDLLSVGGFRESAGDGAARLGARRLAALLPALAAKMVRARRDTPLPGPGLHGWPVRLSWQARSPVPPLPAKLYDGPLFDGPLFDGPLFDESLSDGADLEASSTAGINDEGDAGGPPPAP